MNVIERARQSFELESYTLNKRFGANPQARKMAKKESEDDTERCHCGCWCKGVCPVHEVLE